MSKMRFVLSISGVLLFGLCCVAVAHAQAESSDWAGPYRLSTNEGKASEADCVADQFGYVHCFWIETLYQDGRAVIQYARFDGETWTAPNDIYLKGADIGNVSAAIDQKGTLHIAWAEGLNGPAYHAQAPVQDALLTQNWTRPQQIDVPARRLHLRIDSHDNLHIVYSNQLEVPGVYYLRSEDEGMSWTEPLWLDPDILAGHIPDSLSFELDQDDGLHAVWFYGATDQGGTADWVRYTHSLDAGDTWSPPVNLDQVVAEREHNLTVASPVMAVTGREVHVIWAAGDLPYRYHRYSTDAGLTWSPSRRVFGDLHGQAFDGLTVDGAGRVHFLGQIRYPVGIYHSYWSGDQWSSPSLIYLIAQEDIGAESGMRIHAHGLNPVVRSGNQLILTFGDPPADPNRRLFAMVSTLDDVAPREPDLMPAPLPATTRAPVPDMLAEDEEQVITPTPTALFFDGGGQSPPSISAADQPLRDALIPTILLIGSIIAFRLLWRSLRARLLRMFKADSREAT